MIDVNKEELVQLCKKIISIPSETGNEGQLVEFIASQMNNWGFDNVEVDKYGSIVGMIRGTCGGKSVLLDAHLDTVGVSDIDKWKQSPFSPWVQDGKIYGRGAADMKGSLAAMIMAGKYLVEKRPVGDIYIVGTVAEEPAEGISLIPVLEKYLPTYVVIGEATSLRINIGQRGRGEVTIETFGKSAHSSNPQSGQNAVYMMLDAVDKIKGMSPNEDKLLGKAIMELTDIVSSPYPGLSVIPNYCKATYDRRLLVGDSSETIIKEVSNWINSEESNKLKVSIAETDILTYKGERLQAPKFAPAWKTSLESSLVKDAIRAIQSVGIKPELGAYSFCTNGSGSAGIMSIPTIGFGPGNESEAHIANEWVEIDDLVQAARGYYSLGINLTM
ncbi:MAG: hypothetical protein APF76_06505 [Desulfitibacter sp. BRH_c19]|nr:MAG: hypothetical protein APF76_06505 [Desulfitibacter sp. BRH_c19]